MWNQKEVRPMKIKGWNTFELAWLIVFTGLRVPVSATMIRNCPFEHRKYLDPLVYNDMITKVVILGAPSTGKSTITEELAKRFNTVFMPEYGREYWDKNQVSRRLEPQQLVEIAEGHIEREQLLLADANRYLFVDTNAITTYMFSMDYCGFALPQLEQMAVNAQTRYDICFLCGDDIPYDDTWDRSGDQKRHIFQKRIISDLGERKLPYIELRGGLEERISVVERVLKGFRKYSNTADLMAGSPGTHKKSLPNRAGKL